MIDIEITKDELEGLTSKKDFGNDIIIGEVGENLFKRYLVNHKGLTFIRKSEDKKELKSLLSLNKKQISEEIKLVEAYSKAQGLWHDANNEAAYSEYIELDLSTVVPSIAGPKRPQDRIELSKANMINSQP